MKHLCIVLLVILYVQSGFAETLKVAFVRDNVNDRNHILYIEDNFEDANPDIDLQIVTLTSEKYKNQMPKWLDSDQGPDVMYWYGGERLKQFARQGKLLDLTKFWHENDFDNEFPASILPVISVNKMVYAMPISIFSWGIYYNKDVFEANQISIPTNWNEFLKACDKLASNNIIPIAMGSYEKWTLAAWFDYLDIRLNGVDFHLELIQGFRSFDDDRVREVFSLWATLFEKRYILRGHEKLKWLEVMPFVFRGNAAMTLMGSFLNSRIPLVVTPKIGYFSFPQIMPQYASHQLAPTDVYMVSAKTKQAKEAKKFLKYISQPIVQQAVNAIVSGLPLHKKAHLSDSILSKQAYKLVTSASGIAQFFDRDSAESFSQEAMEYFAVFSKDRNIDAVIEKLEKLRLKLNKSLEQHSLPQH